MPRWGIAKISDLKNSWSFADVFGTHEACNAEDVKKANDAVDRARKTLHNAEARLAKVNQAVIARQGETYPLRPRKGTP